jgi:2-succinyl-5-enolpyruvyl-6-hydroxy-3-cyclohexene-1-carboxylate synthase
VNTANRNSFWASLVAEELHRAGVVAVCISPGSRSTPLAIACYEHQHLRTIVHIDERSGSFFGLGLAKYSRAPVALLCTSGTAAANFYPAIIEAFYAHVPLLVLTADRPPELRDCGAGQTIDQIKLYGDHVRYFFEVGLPDITGFKLRHLRALIGHATAIAMGKATSSAGPVHLNFAFADPLPPVPVNGHVPLDLSQSDPLAWHGREVLLNSLAATNREKAAQVRSPKSNRDANLLSAIDSTGYIQVAKPQLVLSENTLAQLAHLIRHSARGMIVVGVYDAPPDFATAVKQLAQVSGYPLLAEATGMMRSQGVISSYDAFLRSPQFCQAYIPELVIRFGAMPTSKNYRLWLEQHIEKHPAQQIIVGNGSNSDPTHGLGIFINACPIRFCEQLSNYLGTYTFTNANRHQHQHSRQNHDPVTTTISPASQSPHSKQSAPTSDLKLNQLDADIDLLVFKAKQTNWQKALIRADWVAREAIAKCLEPIESMFEGKAFAQLGQWLPIDCCIYVASSMPIRDLDTFFQPADAQLSDFSELSELAEISAKHEPLHRNSQELVNNDAIAASFTPASKSYQDQKDQSISKISNTDSQLNSQLDPGISGNTASNKTPITRVLANRGANGIDGTISSALGATWGSDYNSRQPVILICGDLAFYHDLNGLMAVKQYNLNLTIILLNNNGGGIFDMLPIAEFKQVCEPLFNTPHDLDFAPIVTAYGCEYVAINSWAQFKTEVLASLTKPGTQVLELKSNRQDNQKMRQQIWQEVEIAIAEQFNFKEPDFNS